MCSAVFLCLLSVITITPIYEDTDTHVLALSSSLPLHLSPSLSVSLPFSQCWMILESVLLSILCCTVTYFTSFAVDCMPLTAICGNGTMNGTGNGSMSTAPPEFSNGIAGTSKVGVK